MNPYDPPKPSSGGPGPAGGPGPGSDTVTLTSRVTTGSMLKAQLPLFVLLFFISWLLFSLFTRFLPIPMTNLLAFVIAVVFMAVLWKYKIRQIESREQNTTLTLSPQGVRRQDHLVITEMPWSGLDHFEKRNTLSPNYAGSVIGSSLLAKLFTTVIIPVAANSTRRVELSVLGSGVVRRAPDTGHRDREHAAQVYGLRDDTPRNAEQLMLTPSHFEEEWRTGVIGRYLAHYRPDLVIPGPDEV